MYLGGVMSDEIIVRVEKCASESGMEWDENGKFLDFDSLQFVSCIVSIEDEFSIEIPDIIFDNSENFSIYVLRNIIESITNGDGYEN